METFKIAGVIVGFNALFFALFAWFSSIQFNNIQSQFDSLRNDNREIRSQVYNHIPTQINDLKERMTNLKERVTKLEDKLDRMDEKLDRLIEKD